MFGTLSNHFAEVVSIVAHLVAAASLIAAFTPTPKDDAVLLKLKKIVDLLALRVGFAKASEKGKVE